VVKRGGIRRKVARKGYREEWLTRILKKRRHADDREQRDGAPFCKHKGSVGEKD